MDPSPNALENFGLHHCALIGDDEGVVCALHQGADVNMLDTAGRTAIMAAVAGEHWQNIDACDASFLTENRLNAIRILLSHPDISLLTLNAPQSSMNGVIPLGMAAWLNQPQVVRILLEDSADSVSVDGMDSHGATALMYAARDGSLEVVQLLLSHGARPDFRDHNHRASIQFALAHPQVLWLCETILRRHRWHESKSADRTRLSTSSEHLVELASSSMPFSDDLEPPPISVFTKQATSRLTETLILSIRASDLPFIHSLLFAPSVHASSPPALYPMSVPVLVNLPDSNGWSPIHHCVAMELPSTEILDALYCAGADTALFTMHEQQSPLHILARYAHVPAGHPDRIHSLHDFIVHLVQDLRAPLSARDKHDETCIHIAAEHGESIDLLKLLLECDTTGAVRKLKNSRGLTAMEVSKTEFLPAFGKDDLRSASALSNYTIRPTDSFASLASLSELKAFYFGPQCDSESSSVCSSNSFDIDGSIQLLLSSLRISSPSGHHAKNPAHITQLEACLTETTHQCNLIVQHFRDRIDEVFNMVQDLQKNQERINTVRNAIAFATKGKLVLRGISPLPTKKRQRDSEDSQLTAVSFDEESHTGSAIQTGPLTIEHKGTRSSVASQTALLDQFLVNATVSHSQESTTCRAYVSGLREVERELAELRTSVSVHKSIDPYSPAKPALRLKQLAKKKSKLEDKIRDLQLDHQMIKKDSSFGTSRVKAWLKRMVAPVQSSPTLEFVLDLDEANCNAGRETKTVLDKTTLPKTCGDAIDASIDGALRTSQIVLEAAHRDLQSINQSLETAEHFVEMASHSISRTYRVVKRAVKKRQAMIDELKASTVNDASLAAHHDLSPGYLGYSNALASRPSLASISTIYSNHSSVSLAATLTENDDDDTRIIRRLLLRKIEAQTSGAWDEVDNVTGWLQIVKEAVRGVKRRAYL
ncbi:hypothetical protein B0H34DRAFT_665892 [Crassisporium funariophilum]|nr:hypothetical protein B0H34DRAFT_665892 [Crassisporium funariophilum]